MKPAIFIDKDGTLIPDIPFNTDTSKISFSEGAGTSLNLLYNRGFKIVVISNQPGVARGMFYPEALDLISNCLNRIANLHHFTFSGFYYCMHDATENCSCRKPQPGLILRAADENGIDLRASWMVGDILDDVEAGYAAGCRTVLVDNGGETEWKIKRSRIPDIICGSITDLSAVIPG